MTLSDTIDKFILFEESCKYGVKGPNYKSRRELHEIVKYRMKVVKK